MKWSLPTGIQGILLVGMLVVVGCHRPDTPLSLNNFDPLQDQQFIVEQYLREAALMKQKAKDLRLQAERYAQLFGPDSEWATSATLLANFYEKEAEEREQLAVLHAEIANSHPH